MLTLFNSLLNRVGIIIILAFLLSRISLYKKLVLKNDTNFIEKIGMATLFGVFGIIGTYSGIPVNGAIANSRVIGVFAGGWLGGPFVGLLSGIIAGGHRWAIDIGGFTAAACAVSTIVEGIIGGYIGRLIKDAKKSWFWAFVTGAFSELIQMMIILVLARPFQDAYNLVKIIWFPMIFVNSIGIGIFVALTQSIFLERERIGAAQAQLALNIANKTLPYLRMGFNIESAERTAEIIYKMSDLAAVAITDNEKILAHVGEGEDHHRTGSELMTALTREVIQTREYKIADTAEEIGCYCQSCRLRSAVIAPLLEGKKVIGALKLYKSDKLGITNMDIQLALGLVQLFSTQIELSKLEYQQKLLAKAELRALQAQINPHFLFNALNTIVSFVRTQPENARELIIHLADHLRKNLQFNNEEVDLREEIRNIESYLAIERARFGDKLKIIYDIPAHIQCIIPSLILQPIVENAVKHGIFNKEEGGTVRIIAREIEGYIDLYVEDDGVGIEPDRLSKLLTEIEQQERIGLINVDRRLKVKYGLEYGLEIRSRIGNGTVVKVRIPKEPFDKEESICVVSS
ncbi:MAG: sensor histidine kinase [Thermotaleaceae bacterium]